MVRPLKEYKHKPYNKLNLEPLVFQSCITFANTFTFMNRVFILLVTYLNLDVFCILIGVG